MAKIKLGNVKGPKGDQGVRGSKWYNTDKITGESTSGTAFPDSGISDAMVGDMALNPTTLNLYTCQTAGNAATAKWVFMACIKGPQGVKGDKGDPTTVDAALSATSTNPVQNKVVNQKFQDVQDSLGRITFTRNAKHVKFDMWEDSENRGVDLFVTDDTDSGLIISIAQTGLALFKRTNGSNMMEWQMSRPK